MNNKMNSNKINKNINKGKEVTLVREKEDFRNRGIKSGSADNFRVTEILRNIFMEMNRTEKRIDKSICRRRKQQKQERIKSPE